MIPYHSFPPWKTRDSTHIFSFSSLAFLGRIEGRFIVVDTRHLVCLALLLRKRFIHLNRTKTRMLGSRHGRCV